MDKRQIEQLRKIEQEDGVQFAQIWEGLNNSDKVDYLGAIFWECIQTTEQP